jgi:hypothetical protein
LSEKLKAIAARYSAALSAENRLSIPDEATADRRLLEVLGLMRNGGKTKARVREFLDLVPLCSAEMQERLQQAYREVTTQAGVNH